MNIEKKIKAEYLEKKEAGWINNQPVFELTPMKIQNKTYFVMEYIEYPFAGASIIAIPFSSEVGVYVVLPL